MRYKIILPGIMMLYSLASFSQGKKFVYYFNEKFITTQKSKSVFTGTGTVDNNLIRLEIVNNQTGRIALVEYFTDTSLSVSQGMFQSFFENGIKESAGNYEANKEDGLWKKWDNKGRLVDSTIYDRGKKISSAVFKYYRNGGMYYRFEDFKNDTMQDIFYDESGKITSEATFSGQTGIMKTYNKEGVKIDSVFSRVLIEASFPGGDAAWARYIKEKIVQNIDAITRDGQSGTCRVKFIVDKEGRVKNAEAITMKGSVLAEVALKALTNGPKWNPAIQYGVAVNAYREQPVTFTIQNR
jgi:antitoxin component YwqK of YwqJK toxin-antitoxin module